VSGSPDWEQQIAERDEKIASLEAQVAEAAKSAESAEQLRAEIAELKAQGEFDRVDFTLQLAGARNVKAARALLGEHDGDVEALKEAEPWLFSAKVSAGAKGAGASGGAGGTAGSSAGGAGATGLPNAGAATDDGRTLRHWREIAGLSGDESDKRD